MCEYDRFEIKIGAKIFINRARPKHLELAVDALLNVLGVAYLDNLILAYHPTKTSEDKSDEGLDRLNDGGSVGEASVALMPKERSIATRLTNLTLLWQTLENYAKNERIIQLGVADLDTESLINLHMNCSEKPSIVQINLSTCCVVPPPLQEFCTLNDIQLLTHSDPEGTTFSK